jgi:G3E family GTPase
MPEIMPHPHPHPHDHDHATLPPASSYPEFVEQPPLPIRSRVLVFTGPVGFGKTTLINALLQRRKRGDVWAVLVNDFGQAEHEPGDEDVSIQTFAGCACCTATPVVRTTLVKLFRRSKPRLAVIELSTLGEPDGLANVLKTNFQNQANLECTICMVLVEDHDEIFAGSPTYRAQLEHSDILVLVGGEQEQVDAISDWSSKRQRPKQLFALSGLGAKDIPDELMDRLLG